MSELNFQGISFEETEKAREESKNFAPIPDGVYETKIVNVAITESKSKLHGMKIEFEVIEPKEFAKKKVFKTFWLESANGADKTRTMLGIFSGFLNSCGVDKAERELLFKSGFPPNGLFVSLSEKFYTIEVGHREYDGKTYNEFERVLAAKQAGASF